MKIQHWFFFRFHPEKVPALPSKESFVQVQGAARNCKEPKSNRSIFKPPSRNKEQSIVDTYWSESTLKNKLRSKVFTRMKRVRNISQFQASSSDVTRLGKEQAGGKKCRNSVVMIEESVRNPAVAVRNNLPLNAKNLTSSTCKTVFNSRKASMQAKGTAQKAPAARNSTARANNKTERDDLKQRLQKITLELDRVINKKVNDEKVRRTRKERRASNIGAPSVLNKTIVALKDNTSFNILEPKDVKKANAKSGNEKAVKSLNKSRIQTHVKENTKVIPKKVEPQAINKSAQCHRRCLTRIEKQSNSKVPAKKQILDQSTTHKTATTKANKAKGCVLLYSFAHCIFSGCSDLGSVSYTHLTLPTICSV
eukprot:TRINITY_DN14441_c0_g1_i1.p1 TRINITY_DN14441_c0_g1~~TRINITY_DN14441_c0_g1_i1.p1  ORF type:complete len:366 (-),score=54.93 TRINITY_DN14441_c0_g1_i1:40-1137(-)